MASPLVFTLLWLIFLACVVASNSGGLQLSQVEVTWIKVTAQLLCVGFEMEFKKSSYSTIFVS